ncbi:hypothetical protein H0H93_013220 [Arthromyces matolae]|nr:hypothetical protein H0H93_013220 [Arthromyces matolae]
MNYRIDHRRDAIISSIRSNDYSTLLIHDQLLREIKFNRACRFHGFSEGPLTFAPTYKYDRHSNDYDTSEKRRSPAWCDRVLWRSRVPERVEQLHYRRYEANVSDHKPISAAFRITIRSLKQEARQKVKAAVQASWVEEQDRLLSEAKKFYVRQALHSFIIVRMPLVFVYGYALSFYSRNNVGKDIQPKSARLGFVEAANAFLKIPKVESDDTIVINTVPNVDLDLIQ